eukprot:s2133_g11.t5
MSLLIARVSVLTLLATCVQGLDILGGASQHRHKHKHHKHHHKQHKASATVNSTASALPAAQLLQASLPAVSQPSQPSTATATQQEPQHAVPSQSLAIFDSEAQQALPAIVDDVRKAAAHKAPLDELKKTRDSETKLLEDQEALLKADQTGLDKSVIQQQVESTKAMLQNLDNQIASKRQDAVNILGKALSDARTALAQASSEDSQQRLETAQQAAARLALKQVQAAQKQEVNAKKVIDEAQKVLDIFGGSSAPTVTAAPAAPESGEAKGFFGLTGSAAFRLSMAQVEETVGSDLEPPLLASRRQFPRNAAAQWFPQWFSWLRLGFLCLGLCLGLSRLWKLGALSSSHLSSDPSPLASATLASSSLLPKVAVVPYGVLGVQLDMSHHVVPAAREPAADTVVVDPAGLRFIQDLGPAGRPCGRKAMLKYTRTVKSMSSIRRSAFERRIMSACECFEEEEVEGEGRPLNWTYVGEGRGNWAQSKQLEFVGEGKGDFIKERVPSSRGNCRQFFGFGGCICLFFLVPLLLWLLFFRTHHSMPGADVLFQPVRICQYPASGPEAAGAALILESWAVLDVDADGYLPLSSLPLWHSENLFSGAAIVALNETDAAMMDNDAYVQALLVGDVGGRGLGGLATPDADRWCNGAWILADKNGDNLVTKSELGTLQRDGSFKDSLGKQLFTADGNGDGALTRAEFQTGLATVASTSSSDIGTLYQEVRSKYWLTTKRQYCCNMQGICSFEGPPVTPTTETTTEGPSYDCHEDYDNRLSWPEHERAWCCARYHVACFHAPKELYHCDHGYGAWQTTWSPHKKAWCCFHLGKGCDFHYGHSHTHYYVVHHAAYDCQAGLSNWKAGWSEDKKSWCCQHEGTGCVAQFDCHAGLANSEAGWSPHKKLWCCSHFSLGCPEETPKPFDCLAGLSNWQAGWSSEKKSWCCTHEGKGCESGAGLGLTGRSHARRWPRHFVDQSCNRWMQHNGIGDFIETASCAVFFEHRRCPRHCGALFTGKEAARHLAHECPNREEICPYGCGDRLFGHEIDDGGEHPPECPMNLALAKVEAALKASAVKEYRLALENVYVERDRARARFKARGERDPGPVFTTPECQQRVRRVEAEGLNLLTRARRASKERLQWVIALAALGPGDGTASSQVPPGAARYWDTMDVSKEYTRSSRPWDMSAPILDPLLQTLQDARICGADSKLRRKAEALLFMAVRRCLEAALVTEVSRGDAVRESLLIADAAMEVCELEDCGDLRDLCALAEKEVLRTTLRSLQTTCKEFHQAVKDGDIELAKWLLDREKANPSITDPETGIPPLVMAVKAGDIAMCELLLDRGADVDARCSSDGTSSLHWACHSRTFRAVKLLLERRANPRLQDKRGHDPLVKLVRRDFSSPADACVLSWQQQDSHRLAGPELEGCGGFMTIEAAKVAAESCDCVGFSVHELVAGAEWSEECFHITMHGPGCASAIPSNVAKTEDEASDLVWSHLDAAWTSFLKVKNDPAHDVSALLAVGADPCSEDLKGLTALQHHLLTAPGGGCAACVSALLRGGADVNHRDIGRQATPFILAIQTKRTDLVRLMLKSAWPTPDVDCKAPDGTCALALATALGAREIADMLRKAGASDWADAELRLGSRTIFTFDTRNPPVNN